MKVKLITEPDPIEFELEKSAVCVVDMQNWDIKPGGFFALTGIDTTHGQRVIQPIRNVVEQARSAGIPVIYTKSVIPRDPLLRPDNSSPWYWKGGAGRHSNDPVLERAMCIEGNWGAEIIEELGPKEGDFVIEKTCYSGFVRTDLDMVLRRRGSRYLFLTGIGTPTCVEATARDAYFHEYWPILLSDCCGAISQETHNQALFAIERRYGWVCLSVDFLNAIGGRETVKSER